jgi:hypothetical protein
LPRPQPLSHPHDGSQQLELQPQLGSQQLLHSLPQQSPLPHPHVGSQHDDPAQPHICGGHSQQSLYTEPA